MLWRFFMRDWIDNCSGRGVIRRHGLSSSFNSFRVMPRSPIGEKQVNPQFYKS